MPPPTILCFSDGTGQRGVRLDAGASNVFKMYKCAEGVAGQACFYDAGVGADPENKLSPLDSVSAFLGKATGLGISKNIRDCYDFIVAHHQPDARIGLFGFSRGAYTVRSLGGVLTLCGAPARQQGDIDLSMRTPEAARLRAQLVGEALKIYQTDYGPEGAARRRELAGAYRSKYRCSDADPRVIGVFDTVAALGLPGVMNVFNPLKHKFHDATLSPKVRFGFHALSIDENRKVFAPVLWDESAKAPGQVIEQVWFPGVHSDIGGGYAETELADHVLDWMVGRCSQPAVGLSFNLRALVRRPDVRGKQHDERTGMGRFWLPKDRTGLIAWDATDRAALCPDIEKRFDLSDLAYRPEPLRGHPRVSAYF